MAFGCYPPARDAPINEYESSNLQQPLADPVLKRLAEAGANVSLYRDVHVVFKDATIDENIAQDLARLVDSDLQAGTPASFAEFGSVETVLLAFERCTVGRRELAALSGAKRLSTLKVIDTRLGDQPFADVKSIRGLQEFWLDRVDLGDDDLTFLETSSRLQRLVAKEGRLGDGTLARIRGAREIWELSLERTNVTDDGLRYMSAFPKLTILDLAGCRVTDAGVERLARLTPLKELSLSDTRITDAGVRHLSGLRLRKLVLSNTSTSDACLRYIAEMKSHPILYIGGTRITKDGIAKAFPRRPVVHDK